MHDQIRVPVFKLEHSIRRAAAHWLSLPYSPCARKVGELASLLQTRSRDVERYARVTGAWMGDTGS